jgi:hypothetical protein
VNDGTWLALGSVGAFALAASLRSQKGSLERVELPKLRGKGFPSARTRRKRLHEAALRGVAGRRWYQHAEQEIRTTARAWGVPPVAVAVAVAATSPATPVVNRKRVGGVVRKLYKGGGMGSNIGKARKVVKAWAAGKSAGDVIPARSPGRTTLLRFEECWWELAQRDERACLEAAFPNPDTTKTHAFVRNLLGDPHAVTVDTLLSNGVGVPLKASGEPSLTDARYRHIVHDVRLVAKRLGWEPREAMAAALRRGSSARALPQALRLATITEHDVAFATGQPVTFRFMRNEEPTPRLPKHVQPEYGQDIEPTGRYMLHASLSFQPFATWAGGEVTFTSPIVLEHLGTSSRHPGWKRRLSDAFGGKKGAALTRAILAAGYDAIVTIDSSPRTGSHTSEMVQLAVPSRRRRR